MAVTLVIVSGDLDAMFFPYLIVTSSVTASLSMCKAIVYDLHLVTLLKPVGFCRI